MYISVKEKSPNFNEGLTISQIDAAEDVAKAIQELKENGNLQEDNPYHRPIIETDVYQLRRGLCLPCAASCAINMILNQPKISGRKTSANSEIFTIGDIYRLLIPHHGKYQSEELPYGWLVVNKEGDMYHHSIIAFAQIFGIFGYSFTGINDFSVLKPLVSLDLSVIISLNNTFVIDQTLKNNPGYVEKRDGETFIKVLTNNGYEFKPFRDGRHVVTILQIDKNNITIADSFNLPQNYNPNGIITTIPVALANQYLTYHDDSPTRGIVFSRHPINNLPFPQNNIIIPQQVLNALQLKN